MMTKGKTVKIIHTSSGPPWYGGGKFPCFKTNPTGEEFLFVRDQACDIVQDAINMEERKLAETAKDPWTKRCLERSDKKT